MISTKENNALLGCYWKLSQLLVNSFTTEAVIIQKPVMKELMGNCYHKRWIFFYLKNWENFYGLSLIALVGYRRESWSVMALPGHLERFALFIKSNMISCTYLIDLNSIKSKYMFVCTTFLLNAISLLLWFVLKSISFAILFRFYTNIIFKWLD